MTPEQAFKLGNQPIALCADGRMAMMICWPRDDGLCGLQVHGEEDIRWVHCDDLEVSAEGALKQRGAPPYPVSRVRPKTETSDLAHMLFAMCWLDAGGGQFLGSERPKPRSIVHAQTKLFIDGEEFKAYGFRLEDDAHTQAVPSVGDIQKRVVLFSNRYLIVEAPSRLPDGPHSVRIEFPDGRERALRVESVDRDGERVFRILDATE